MSKSLKFLIACGMVFVLGLVMTVGGCAAGGKEGLKKAAREKGWTYNGEDVETVLDENIYEFDSVRLTGYTDLKIAGSSYYSVAADDADLWGTEPEPGKVAVISEKGRSGPSVSVEGSTLVIEGGNSSQYTRNFEPEVVIFCDDKELKSIDINSEACDVEICGVRFANANIETNAGDIDCKDIVSGGIKIHNDAGDTDLSGDLNGTTDVESEAGSIEAVVKGDLKSYTMELKTGAGDIEVDEKEIEGKSYSQSGGKGTLKLKTDAGEIEVRKL